MVIREAGYGWRAMVYQLKKNFIAEISQTLLPTHIDPSGLGWAGLSMPTCVQSSWGT